MNRDGKMMTTNYGRCAAMAIDPIEKKPFYHYRPKSLILSLGPNSCNLSCQFCQNYQISQFESDTFMLSVQELKKKMFLSVAPRQIAFTYTEPVTWFEFIIDFCKEAPDVSVLLVTNGFINSEPLSELLPYISAMNIDLKSITPEFYKAYCGGILEVVLDTITRANACGIHIEITNLIIPRLNDSFKEIEHLSKFIADINPDIPLHFSAYHPSFMLKIPQSTKENILEACAIGKEYLNYVYSGNVGYSIWSNTYCPNCNTLLISRNPIRMNNIVKIGRASCRERV